jgi:hypothetical protein
MDGGRSIDAAGYVFGVDCTVSQVRAAGPHATLRGSLGASHRVTIQRPKPVASLEKYREK